MSFRIDLIWRVLHVVVKGRLTASNWAMTKIVGKKRVGTTSVGIQPRPKPRVQTQKEVWGSTLVVTTTWWAVLYAGFLHSRIGGVRDQMCTLLGPKVNCEMRVDIFFFFITLKPRVE